MVCTACDGHADAQLSAQKADHLQHVGGEARGNSGLDCHGQLAVLRCGQEPLVPRKVVPQQRLPLLILLRQSVPTSCWHGHCATRPQIGLCYLPK